MLIFKFPSYPDFLYLIHLIGLRDLVYLRAGTMKFESLLQLPTVGRALGRKVLGASKKA